MLREVQSKCEVVGRNELHEGVSMMNKIKNSKGWGADRPHWRREDGLT